MKSETPWWARRWDAAVRVGPASPRARSGEPAPIPLRHPLAGVLAALLVAVHSGRGEGVEMPTTIFSPVPLVVCAYRSAPARSASLAYAKQRHDMPQGLLRPGMVQVSQQRLDACPNMLRVVLPMAAEQPCVTEPRVDIRDEDVLDRNFKRRDRVVVERDVEPLVQLPQLRFPLSSTRTSWILLTLCYSAIFFLFEKSDSV